MPTPAAAPEGGVDAPARDVLATFEASVDSRANVLADAFAERALDAPADAPADAPPDAPREVGADASLDTATDRADASVDVAVDRAEVPPADAAGDLGVMDAEAGCSSSLHRDASAEVGADVVSAPDGDAPAPVLTFYVAPTGVDPPSPTGNINALCDAGRGVATPFATLNRALDCIQWGVFGRPAVGATIYLRGGVYDVALDGAFTARGGASWEQPVTLASYPGEQAVLRPSPTRAANFVIALQHPDERYIVFDGLVIDGLNVALDAVKITHMGSDTSRTAHHVRFQNCEVRNAARGHGLLVGGHHNEFINLRVHHNGLALVGMPNTGYGFYIGSPDNLVERCDVYENAGYGIHVYNTRPMVPAPFTRTDRTVVRFNYVHDNARVLPYPGIILSSGEDLVAHHNVVVGAGLQAAYEGVRNAQLYNNTVVDPSSGVCVSSFGDVVVTMRNNLCHAAGAVLRLADPMDFIIASNNLLNIDPLFVNRAGRDFNPSPSSPAYDHGVAITGLAYNGPAPEAGALEAPVLRSAELLAPARDIVRVTVENNLHPPLLPTTGCAGFTITADGAPVAISGCARVGVDRFDLTLASPASPCAALRLSYANGNVTDSARIGGRFNASLRTFVGRAVATP